MHVIVGAGAVGSATANLLAAAGQPVRIVTRSGGGPAHPLIERVAADATDAATLCRLTGGAAALYNCANPPYHSWPTDWPPLAAALLTAAESSGAPLVITGNLYVYGKVDRPMTPDMPLAAHTVKGRVRVRMWNDALAAHRAGRIRVTEARASDFMCRSTSSRLRRSVGSRSSASRFSTSFQVRFGSSFISFLLGPASRRGWYR